MSLEVKKAKIKELLNRKILTPAEHDRIIDVLTEMADNSDQAEAYKNIYNICKKNTSKQLLAPKSAVYPDFSADMIEPLDEDSYLISFYVDSENKKGTMLRTSIRCKVVNGKYDGTSFLIKKMKTRFGGVKVGEEWSQFTKPK